MQPRSSIAVAPYPVRLRLALTGLMLAWLLAALFLLLGWRASTKANAEVRSPGTASTLASTVPATPHPLAPAEQ
jgi:hypothetical protein